MTYMQPSKHVYALKRFPGEAHLEPAIVTATKQGIANTLVVYQGRRQPDTSLQSVVQGVVLAAVGTVNIWKLSSLNQVHDGLAPSRLPCLDEDGLAVVARCPRIFFDLWLHNALLAGMAILAGSRALVNAELAQLLHGGSASETRAQTAQIAMLSVGTKFLCGLCNVRISNTRTLGSPLTGYFYLFKIIAHQWKNVREYIVDILLKHPCSYISERTIGILNILHEACCPQKTASHLPIKVVHSLSRSRNHLETHPLKIISDRLALPLMSEEEVFSIHITEGAHDVVENLDSNGNFAGHLYEHEKFFRLIAILAAAGFPLAAFRLGCSNPGGLRASSVCSNSQLPNGKRRCSGNTDTYPSNNQSTYCNSNSAGTSNHRPRVPPNDAVCDTRLHARADSIPQLLQSIHLSSPPLWAGTHSAMIAPRRIPANG